MDIDRTPPSGGAQRAPTALSPGTSIPSSPELSPLRDVPGETFIGEDETAGLPGRDLEAYSHQQAAKVVRAHKLNFLKFRGKRMPARGRSRSSEPLTDGDRKGKQPRRSFFKERASGADIEKSADVRSYEARAAPRGVLSTLLSIYEPASALQSGATTPARSSADESRPASLYRGPASAASSALSFRPPNHPWTRTLAFGESRPPKSRSSAGVFGPLIASAGNIAGAAAPTSATLAPDLKRPGYHLSRCGKWSLGGEGCMLMRGMQILAR